MTTNTNSKLVLRMLAPTDLLFGDMVIGPLGRQIEVEPWPRALGDYDQYGDAEGLIPTLIDPARGHYCHGCPRD